MLGFNRSFSFLPAFHLRFVCFTTARNDIAPTLPRTPFCRLCPRPQVRGETFPALVAHSLSRLLRWHIASPPSLSVVSLQNTCSYSQCSMDFFKPVCRFFGCLPPLSFANPSCSISPCPLIQCSCAFSYLCRHLLALSRSPLFILSYSRHRLIFTLQR